MIQPTPCHFSHLTCSSPTPSGSASPTGLPSASGPTRHTVTSGPLHLLFIALEVCMAPLIFFRFDVTFSVRLFLTTLYKRCPIPEYLSPSLLFLRDTHFHLTCCVYTYIYLLVYGLSPLAEGKLHKDMDFHVLSLSDNTDGLIGEGSRD